MFLTVLAAATAAAVLTWAVQARFGALRTAYTLGRRHAAFGTDTGALWLECGGACAHLTTRHDPAGHAATCRDCGATRHWKET
jgi:hypothetical protein